MGGAGYVQDRWLDPQDRLVGDASTSAEAAPDPVAEVPTLGRLTYAMQPPAYAGEATSG